MHITADNIGRCPAKMAYKSSSSASLRLCCSDSVDSQLALPSDVVDRRITTSIPSFFAGSLMDLKRIHSFEIPRQAHLALEEGDDSR